MIKPQLQLAAFILGSLAPQAALALDWEIERNFRYFLYRLRRGGAARGARPLYRRERRGSDAGAA